MSNETEVNTNRHIFNPMSEGQTPGWNSTDNETNAVLDDAWNPGSRTPIPEWNPFRDMIVDEETRRSPSPAPTIVTSVPSVTEGTSSTDAQGSLIQYKLYYLSHSLSR